LSIRFDLLPPEFRIPLGPRSVFGTTMPKATIDEDGDLSTRECHVRHAAGLFQYFVVDPIAQTDAMHLLPQRYFRPCPFLPHFRHPTTDGR